MERKGQEAQKISIFPRQEHPSTYFVQDRSNEEELTRLQAQDALVTAALGGVIPEQPHPERFHRILDVGCGTGGWLIAMARTYPEISLLIGIDISGKMLDYARAQAEAEGVADRVEFHVMDALRMLEFPTSFFDLVNQRLGASFLRTWDWPKILQEYQRVSKGGGIIRITEGELGGENTSPALGRLELLARQAFYQAGHSFTPERDSVPGHLVRMMRQYGLSDVQVRPYTLEHRANTEQGDFLFENTRHVYRTIIPFLRKWTRVPDEYENLYQQALRDLQRPDFAGSWKLVTAWGVNVGQD